MKWKITYMHGREVASRKLGVRENYKCADCGSHGVDMICELGPQDLYSPYPNQFPTSPQVWIYCGRCEVG